jgi:hypothetical protein
MNDKKLLINRILTELGQRSLIKTFEQNNIVCESVLSMKSEELANFGLKSGDAAALKYKCRLAIGSDNPVINKSKVTPNQNHRQNIFSRKSTKIKHRINVVVIDDPECVSFLLTQNKFFSIFFSRLKAPKIVW